MNVNPAKWTPQRTQHDKVGGGQKVISGGPTTFSRESNKLKHSFNFTKLNKCVKIDRSNEIIVQSSMKSQGEKI